MNRTPKHNRRCIRALKFAACQWCENMHDETVLTPVVDRANNEWLICPFCWLEHETQFVPLPLGYKLRSRYSP